jgi:hypothetical protein
VPFKAKEGDELYLRVDRAFNIPNFEFVTAERMNLELAAAKKKKSKGDGLAEGRY